MMYLQVLISAENKGEASTILDALLAKKLILGGPILEGPAKFWWKGEIVSMNYAYILTYTTEKHRNAVVEEVRKTTSEEVPMISFISFEPNLELAKLIDETLT